VKLNRQGNKSSKPLVIPYKLKEGSKARKEEEQHQEHLKSITESIHLFKKINQHAWVNGKARCFASVSLGESVM
jgi:hypothetical protein